MFFARLCVLLLRGNFLSTSSHFQRQTNSLLVVEYKYNIGDDFFKILSNKVCVEGVNIYTNEEL